MQRIDMANDDRVSTLDDWQHVDWRRVTRGMLRRVIPKGPCDFVVVAPRWVLDNAVLKKIWDETQAAERVRMECEEAQARLMRELDAAAAESD